VKLLFEYWRQYLNEGALDTGGMLNSPRQVALDYTERVKETTNHLGYHLDRKLGKGMMGEVYLVEDKETGERRAMKVVTKRLYGGPKTSEREADNYRFAMENKGSMPKEYAKYLPDVYEVVSEPKDYYIFMEVLEEIPERVRLDLLAPGTEEELEQDRSQKHDRIFKDPKALYSIIMSVLSNNELISQNSAHNEIRMQAPNKIIKSFYEMPKQTLQSFHTAIVRETLPYLNQDEIFSKGQGMERQYRTKARKDIEYYLDKQIVPVHQGDEDDYSYASGAAEDVAQVFPEAENLLRAMRYFKKDQNWQPKDVHSQNVMMRPSTNDFVIVDLGLFKKEELK
jgi:serine/threonine protein kinase